jgi:RNA polymerase subunit RPABC4/transcription elongation factor Spt4
MEVKVNNRLRKYKKMLNLELFEKYGIGGIYAEYMQRSFCKCGYVSNERLHVCPQCGQQNFIESQYKIILQKDDPTVSIVGNEIQQSVDTLEYAYTKDEAVLELVESKKVLYTLKEDIAGSKSYYGGYYHSSYDDATSEQFREIIKKNKRKFTTEYISAIILAEELGAERPELTAQSWKRYMRPECLQAAQHIKNYKDSNKSLLNALLSDASNNNLNDCRSLNEFIRENNIPSILEKHLNSKVLNDFMGRGGYYYRSNSEEFEKTYANMPEIMKNIMVHYYLNGLIDVEQLKHAPAVSLELWNINPDLALTQLKKYFINFTGGRRNYYGYWNRNNKPGTMDEIVDYYNAEGLPIEEGNFDLRNYNAMKNNQIFIEAGWDELTVSVETANMETSPVQSLINIATTRRKRKKKDED